MKLRYDQIKNLVHSIILINSTTTNVYLSSVDEWIREDTVSFSARLNDTRYNRWMDLPATRTRTET